MIDNKRTKMEAEFMPNQLWRQVALIKPWERAGLVLQESLAQAFNSVAKSSNLGFQKTYSLGVMFWSTALNQLYHTEQT